MSFEENVEICYQIHTVETEYSEQADANLVQFSGATV